MISPTFYNKKNLVAEYLGGLVPHYAVKDPSVTLEWYEYILQVNETLYTVAERLFGKNLEYMWTYIADNNPPRPVDDWRVGDVIRLPKIIIRDTDTIKQNFPNV